MSGSEITTSDKYTISSSDGVNTIVLENGTTLPSVIVSLTIHSLTSADEGDYTCRGTRGESVIRLTGMEETDTTIFLPTHSTLGKEASSLQVSPHYCFYSNTDQNEEQSISIFGVSVIATLVILILAMTVVILSLIIIIIFQLKKTKKLSAALNRINVTNPLNSNDMALNYAYRSESSSIDTNAYEIIPENTNITAASTTLTRNSAYQRQNVWLSSADGNGSPREQPLSYFDGTERDSDSESIVTRQRVPSDYLVATSIRANEETTVESSEELQQERSTEAVSCETNRQPCTTVYDHLETEHQELQQQTSDLEHKHTAPHSTGVEDVTDNSEWLEQRNSSQVMTDLILVSSEENGQLQELYLDNSNKEEFEGVNQQQQPRNDTEHSIQSEVDL